MEIGAMDQHTSESLDKIRQQFDNSPYPRNPLEESPKSNLGWLYIQNLVTPYYLRNKKVIPTEGKLILDAGCGTGFTSLVLAESNPGAKIIGVDLSEESVKLAEKRLEYHGFTNVEFHALSIEDIPTLGVEFDYINCDEVLYLLPDPVLGLKAMRSVLKPDGIIRANLHSAINRANYFRAQEVFKMMGLMEENPREMEIDLVHETMNALKDQVVLKRQTWGSVFEENKEAVLTNQLLLGDKGFTIPGMFSALKAAELEFISMVSWRKWELMDLFKDPDNLPVFLALSLPETSAEERLHLFELLNPIHRVLDFWCGHPNQAQPFIPMTEWTDSDWYNTKVYLHPQMTRSEIQEELLRCVTQLQPFEISQYLQVTAQSSLVDCTVAACLLPLWESVQDLPSLVARWLQLRPVNPVTLEPTTQEEALEVLTEALSGLEEWGYVLLEHQS
jgi:2-polyprenyl-3-methyl-5-hydroxy-6-metoxy-1,4-benzoquinol methylase